MDTTRVVILIVVVVLLLAALAVGLRTARRKKQTADLRGQFGPEYDATVGSRGDRDGGRAGAGRAPAPAGPAGAARARAGRREELTRQWQPGAGAFRRRAGPRHLRGARPGPPGAQRARLPDAGPRQPDRPGLGRPPRGGGGLPRGRSPDACRERGAEATTEDLREAMVHYRSLFARLLGNGNGSGGPHRVRDHRHRRGPGRPPGAGRHQRRCQPSGPDTTPLTPGPAACAGPAHRGPHRLPVLRAPAGGWVSDDAGSARPTSGRSRAGRHRACAPRPGPRAGR